MNMANGIFAAPNAGVYHFQIFRLVKVMRAFVFGYTYVTATSYFCDPRIDVSFSSFEYLFALERTGLSSPWTNSNLHEGDYN